MRTTHPVESIRAEPSERAAESLGSAHFRREHRLRYAYLCGSMYRGIASKELVVSAGKAGLMGFLGTGGLGMDRIRSDIGFIQKALSCGEAYGVNLICNVSDPSVEMKTAEVYLEKGVQKIEASAFMQVTPALVYYRLTGLEKKPDGSVECRHKILAKISRPEVATAFMSPPPERIVAKLLSENRITREQAQAAQAIRMADDLCVEADSGGHTDQGVAAVLLPAIQRLRKEMGLDEQRLRVGLAGGIGTPEAIAAAFVLGADFVMTGSINQCTVESGTSDAVKDLLQNISIQDTAYAPAGDMFELGAKVQVLKKGLLFPARANRLFMLYSHYNSLEELPEAIRRQLEDKYFKKSLEAVWQETRAYFEANGQAEEVERGRVNPKHKMALVFRWYFGYSIRLAFSGNEENRVDYQVHTGPAMGAFNQWVKGTGWESWRARHVDQIAHKLMRDAAIVLESRLRGLLQGPNLTAGPSLTMDIDRTRERA